MKNHRLDIPPFRLGDNSVHLYECSPFSVGIFVFLKKKNLCFLFDVDMRILIGESLKHFYML